MAPASVPDPVRLQLQPRVSTSAKAEPQSQAAAADSTGEEGLPILTLTQALREADKRNPSLEEARTQLVQAQLYSRKAWANYLPQISAGASYTHQSEGSVVSPSKVIITGVDPTTDAPTGIAISDPTSDIYMNVGVDTFAAQLSLQQPLIVPALWAAIKSTYIAERMVDLTVENVRRELLFGVSQLYFGAATLKETIAVRKRMLTNTEAHERDARVRFEAGVAPKIQLIRAQIDTVAAQQQVLQAENSYLTAKLSLAALLDRDDVNFDVEVPEPVTAPQGSMEELLDTANTKRPDLLSARDNVKVAEYGMDQAVLSYLPNLFLTAAYQWARPSYEISESMQAMMDLQGSAMTDDQKWVKSWNIGLALSWTIWDGGLREVTLKENSAKITAANAALRGKEAAVREEVRSAVVSLESAQSNIVSAQEQLKLARENSDMVSVNYNAGVATQLDVSDANTTLIGAELNLLAQTLQAQISALSLVKAAGLFDPPRTDDKSGSENTK
ncbi:MAG: TolC family protein [Myxococcales bacterium]|nr:TolC family protein [Myxococcales bacterium]